MNWTMFSTRKSRDGKFRLLKLPSGKKISNLGTKPNKMGMLSSWLGWLHSWLSGLFVIRLKTRLANYTKLITNKNGTYEKRHLEDGAQLLDVSNQYRND